MTAEENLAFGLRLHKTPRPSSSGSPRWPGCCRRDGRGPAPRQTATTWRALLCQQAVGILACAFWAYRALQLQAPDQPPVLRFVAADQDGGVHRPDLPGAWSTSIGELQNPLTHPSARCGALEVDVVLSGFGLLAGLQAGDLGPGGGHQLLVGVGVAVQAPTSVGRLGQQHPGPAGQPRVTGGVGGDAGQLLDHGQLLAAIERAGVGEDLDPHVGGCPAPARWS